MTNTEFKAMNDEELAMVAGGEGPISGWISILKDSKVQGIIKQFGVRYVQSAGQTVNDIVNSVMDTYRSIKNWF